jgi:hypothetical protein
MKRAIVIVGVLVLFVSSACTTRKREEQLDKKQAELNQREQELLLRESSLNLRDEELTKKEKELDSLDSAAVKDTTVFHNNPDLVGSWQVKMTCVETTCPGSAVGDTKIEQWDIEYQGDHIIAKANVGDQLVRVYSGLATGNRLELIQHTDSASMTYDTRMIVRLRMLNKQSIEGEREIIREKQCKIVYSLRMDKL